MLEIDEKLINKYDRLVPRYTIYPTINNWNISYNDTDKEVHKDNLKKTFASNSKIAIYVHVPFCKKLCFYCGCLTYIKNKDEDKNDISNTYVDYVIKELNLLSEYSNIHHTVYQIHFGGGTPHFLSNKQLAKIINKIKEIFQVSNSAEIAIEANPGILKPYDLEILKTIGFNRISFGIQDTNYEVQKAVNRIHDLSVIKKIYDKARDLDFSSINFDLIYGLPYQTVDSFANTIREIYDLRPDRLAIYAYAHVPWKAKHQKAIDEKALPSKKDKLNIFINASEFLLTNGYKQIGLDHFVLSNDEMYKSKLNGTLYRNCMGYTINKDALYLGIGASSISYIAGHHLYQNYHDLKNYYGKLDICELPIIKNMVLVQDDIMREWVINHMMCYYHVSKLDFENLFKIPFDEYFKKELKDIDENHSILFASNGQATFSLTEIGKLFMRNACALFDKYITSQGENKKFSSSI